MASNFQEFVTKITLNAEEAKKQLDILSARTKEYRKLRDDAAKAGDKKVMEKYANEVVQLEKAMSRYRTQSQNVAKTLKNLSGATMRDLKKAQSAINKEMQETPRNTEYYRQLSRALQDVKAEMKSVKEETKESQSIFDEMRKWGTRYLGIYTIGKDVISSVVNFSREYVDEFIKIDTAMTNVRKYTGQTMEEVKAMNETFKQMDTATSREELNALAGAAGRLGITSRQSIEEFVSAADTINIALGDDLGEGAIDQIGKLAMAFGEDDKMGLRGAMLATGSAVNELAQNSAANAGYLVDFTARVAGAARNLGMSQADIMGFGAVMDENLLRDEMASTAFANMLTKMATDTQKFADIAGMNAKDFANLMKNDVNGAVLAVADSLKKQDPETMMKMLNDMGLDGSRAVSVLSTLADKIDDVRERQRIANEAYREGTSISKEAELQNQSNERQLMKVQKQISDLKAELGEELYPVIIGSAKGTREAMDVVVEIIRWTKQHITTLARYAVEIAVVTAALNMQTIAEKARAAAGLISIARIKAAAVAERAYAATVALTRNTLLAMQLVWTLCTKGVNAYTIALRAARLASLTNPWTALATVLLTVGVAVYELVKAFGKESEEAKKAKAATEEFNAVQKMLRSVNEEANSSVAEEITRLKLLRSTLEDNKKSLNERKKALEEIKKICPDYHGQLTTENTLINSNTSALDDYCNNLIRAARAQAAFNKMVKLEEISLSREELKQGREENKIWAQNQLKKKGVSEKTTFKYADWNVGYAMYDENGKFVKYVDAEQKKQITHLQDLIKWNDKRIAQEQAILDLNKKQSDALQKIINEGKTDNAPKNTANDPTATDKPTIYGSGYTSDSDRKKQQQAADKREQERKEALRKEISDQKALNDALQAQNMSDYYQGEKTYREYIAKQHDLTVEGYDALIAIYKKYGENYLQLSDERAKAVMAKEDETSKQSLADLERRYQSERILLQQQYYDPKSKIYQNEEALNEALFQLDIQYMQEKANLQRKGSEERADTEAEITMREEEHKIELAEHYQQMLDRYREQWGEMSNDMQMNTALKGLEDLHKKQLLSEEEYQRMKLAIQAQYAKNPTELKNEAFDAKVNDAISVAKSQAKGGYDKTAGLSFTNNPFVGQISQYKSVIEQLKTLRDQDKISHAEYEQAKAQVTSDFLNNMVAGAQAAYNSVNNLMSAASSYYAAQSQYEQNVTTKKYDKLIAAAGNNDAKKKKLEEKREKELAKIKTKYNKKAMKIELAQAFASTALAAINSYASASKVHWALGAVAAAMAVAAGMFQIAAIKKQHQAEEAGYYSGGFTGGRDYRKTAGVVHEGEFVVNHDGVNNPNLMPIIQMIDRAQKNNTIGTLTASDVSRTIGQGSTVVTPVVNVQNDNSELAGSMSALNEVVDRLSGQIDKGITARVSIDGSDGVAHQLDRYNKMRANV